MNEKAGWFAKFADAKAKTLTQKSLKFLEEIEMSKTQLSAERN